jgi:CspA family cold shock protein
MIGTVKRFFEDRGFGFLSPDNGGDDIFIHASAITRAGLAGLKPGERVSFDTEEAPKGPRAINIRLLEHHE